MGRGDDPPLGGSSSGEDAETVLLQFGGDGTHPIAGHGVGLDVAMHDQYGKLEVFIHGAIRHPLSDWATALS
ncbi:hypothetical protein D3C80_1812100 [compost metagenome]